MGMPTLLLEIIMLVVLELQEDSFETRKYVSSKVPQILQRKELDLSNNDCA